MFDLTKKIALITGASRGLGWSMAQSLAKAGAHVVLNARDEKLLSERVKTLSDQGLSAQAAAFDVTNFEAAQACINDIKKQWGRIDILIANAGINHRQAIQDFELENFEKVINTNFKAIWVLCKAVTPLMVEKKNGRIILIGSMSAINARPSISAYVASKGAVHAMSMSVAKDFIKDNIRCNTISPGRVHTPFVDGFLKKNYPGQEAEMFEKLSKTQPIGRMGQPIEVAHQALYLCSEEASFITGSDFSLDGGFVTLNS